jgi:F0F1-type ATP synthase gamma subunit
MRSLLTIKRKIRSIKETAKITNAMKLISASKNKKTQNNFRERKDFFNVFYMIMEQIMHKAPKENIFDNENIHNHKKL